MPSLLRTDELTKQYGAVRALDGLTIDLAPGLIGLVGANGAGKTTFFRILLGLSRPTAGSVEVLGRNVAADPVGARSRVGYMPEHECLPNDQSAADLVSTLGELSGLPPSAARQRASDVLHLVGLDEERFRPVGTFSTGMKQRAKLAQALVADPELVLLDEPTAGLDPSGRQSMLDLVARLKSFGVSAMLATHLLDDVQRVCDQVVMLDGGRLVAAGPTADLVRPTSTIVVEVDGPNDGLMRALGRRKLVAEVVDDHHLEVTITSDDDLDHIRDAVARLGLPLTRLTPGSTSLDQLFVSEVGQ